jgi:DNA polymerase V
MDAGISDGDIIVIDRSLEVNDGDFVVAFIDGDFTLKEFKRDKDNHCAWLIPHNDSYSPIKVTEDNNFIVWGVLTYTIKKLHR